MKKIGIVGAGTMGSGIALAALYSDLSVVLQDIAPPVLERAADYMDQFLARKGLQASRDRLALTTDLAELAGMDVVIEAAPEDLALKQDLFARLDSVCAPPAILATNTSTLSVSAIAAATRSPGRVAGMHFFNPAPVLPLVEIVRGDESTPEAVEALIVLAKQLGKTPVVARDTPGFIVNRVARPFYAEALRLIGEGVADHETLDRLVTLGAGFRMGPFQLMDLIGLDINFAAMQSMYAQTFGEPRYRPHPIQARLVAQNRLGRKTGRGFYVYPENGAIPARQERRTPAPVKLSGNLAVANGSWAPLLAERLRAAGITLGPIDPLPASLSGGFVLAGRDEGLLDAAASLDRSLPPEAPLLCQVVDVSHSEVAAGVKNPERLVGFDGLFAGSGEVITLVAHPGATPETIAKAEELFQAIGCETVWITDSPGLVLPRMVCALANEAAFAVQEGVADPDTVDLAMRLGVNYPLGPIEWARRIGLQRVVAVLDHLRAEYGEERYRAATLLRRWSRLERVPLC